VKGSRSQVSGVRNQKEESEHQSDDTGNDVTAADQE